MYQQVQLQKQIICTQIGFQKKNQMKQTRIQITENILQSYLQCKNDTFLDWIE